MHLDCFRVFIIVNSAAVDTNFLNYSFIWIYAQEWDILTFQIRVFIFSRFIPKSEVAESYEWFSFQSNSMLVLDLGAFTSDSLI